MTEKNSKRGRKPNINETKLVYLHTSKKVTVIINGTDEVNIPKNSNLMVIRS